MDVLHLMNYICKAEGLRERVEMALLGTPFFCSGEGRDGCSSRLRTHTALGRSHHPNGFCGHAFH